MPSMEFHFEDPQSGDTHALNETDIVNQLKSAGQDVQGVSADGTMLTIGQAPAGGKGAASAVQVPTANALKALGYDVKGMKPLNADAEHVDDQLSALVQSLPDDDHAKSSYIKAKLAHRGVHDPQVAGMGNDWHVFNPETSQWVQVTRDPGLNMAGLYSAGLALPHIIGAGLGGTAGAALGLPGGGFGAVPGAVAGGALGSAAGSALTKGAISMFDDDYRHVTGDNLGKAAWDTAKTAGMDGLAMGGGQLLKGIAPVSKALQVGGKTLDATGKVLGGTAGRLASSPTAVSVATDFVPGLGSANGAAQFAQLPGAAMRGAAGLAAGADGEVGSAFLGDDMARRIGQYGRSIIQRRPSPTGLKATMQDGAEELGSALGRQAPAAELSERDILGNVVSRNRATKAYDMSHGWRQAEEQAVKEAAEFAEPYGLSAEEHGALANETRQGVRNDAINQMMRQDMSEENWGTKVGSGLRNLRQAGEGAQKMAEGTVRTGLRGVQLGGKLAEGLGSAARAVGTVTEPLELPMGLRYGLPKVKNWWEDQHNEP